MILAVVNFIFAILSFMCLFKSINESDAKVRRNLIVIFIFVTSVFIVNGIALFR